MAGSLGNLYRSIQSMGETCFQSSQTKETVLNPKLTFSATQVPFLPLDIGTSSAKTPCGSTQPFFSDFDRVICPSCKTSFSKENEAAEVGKGGFVKGEVTYMVMDNLEVTPMSTSSWINVVNKFYVNKRDALEEKVVDFGRPEGLKLLEASWNTNQVLTSVFPVEARIRYIACGNWDEED